MRGSSIRFLIGASLLPQLGAAAHAQTTPAADAAETAAIQTQPEVAADAGAPSAEPAADGEIVITGSRLGATGFSAPTPVTVIGEGKLETRAPANIADVINEIPSFRRSTGPSQTQAFSAGSGQNTLDLRGLGVTRTLMLIDGRRQATNDTNVIPVGLVDRVEVVTGGASAAYGSDAVAGVVNFVLKKRLEGIEGSVQAGVSQRGDNSERVVNLAGGLNFADGRGRLVTGVDYVDNDGVGTIYTRGWGRRQFGQVIFGPLATRGSLPALGFLPNVTYSQQSAGGVINGGPLAFTEFGPGGTPRPFQRGAVYSNQMVGGDNYGQNTQGNYTLLVPIERVAALSHAEFDVSDSFHLFAEGSYAYVKGDAFTSYFQAPTTIISINNPFVPAATRAAAIAAGLNPVTGTFPVGRTWTELGGYLLPTRRHTYRGAVGASGELFGGLKWDVTYEYNYNRNSTSNATTFITGALLQASNAVRDASGNIVCGSLASNPNIGAVQLAQIARYQSLNPTPCVPINIFGKGSPSAEALNYVTGNGLRNLTILKNHLQVIAGNLRGSPFSTWAGPVAVAVGGEYRKQKIDSLADPLSQTQTWSSTNGATYNGSLNVKEAYIEVGVPLARDLPFANALDLNAAARYTDYSTSGSVTTWKVGVTYEPVEALRFRVTRSRDIRAPNLVDLFQAGATLPFTSILNPINGQSGSLNTIASGNPDLTAEIADTTTGGVVFQPKWEWARGFRASVDYYLIKVDDVIASVTPAEVLRRCALGQQVYCAAITFDNSTYGIALLRLQPFNLNQLKTSGLDFEISYRSSLEGIGLPGNLTVRGLANHVIELKTTDASGTIDRAGSLAQGGTPSWTANVDVTYDNGGFAGTVGVRYINSPRYDATFIGPDDSRYNPALPTSINDNRLPAAAYVDLSLKQDIAMPGGQKFQVFGVVSNLLDKDPPGPAILLQMGGNPYDFIGRTFKAGARFKF